MKCECDGGFCPECGEWVEGKPIALNPGAYHLISGKILEAINRFALLHEKKGGFLMAVFSNNLREAIAHADDQNRPVIVQILGYCYNEIPGSCWGSPEMVKAWLEIPKEKWRPYSVPESTKELARQESLGIWCRTNFISEREEESNDPGK